MRRGPTPSGRAKWPRDVASVSEDLGVNLGSSIPSLVLISCVILVGPLTSALNHAQPNSQDFGMEQRNRGS